MCRRSLSGDLRRVHSLRSGKTPTLVATLLTRSTRVRGATLMAMRGPVVLFPFGGGGHIAGWALFSLLLLWIQGGLHGGGGSLGAGAARAWWWGGEGGGLEGGGGPRSRPPGGAWGEVSGQGCPGAVRAYACSGCEGRSRPLFPQELTLRPLPYASHEACKSRMTPTCCHAKAADANIAATLNKAQAGGATVH